MRMSKVSIIVPTIARATLIKTLESISKQTYRDFELVVTDDTDGKALDIVEVFRKNHPQIKVKYVINQKYVKGPGGNKNNGLDYAEGEFVTIVDDDDELFPEAIETGMKHIEEKDLEVFLANCIDNVKGEKTGLSYGVSEYLTYYDFLRGRYDGEYFGIVKKSLIGDDRFPEDAWGAEGVLWYKVLKKAKRIYYFDKPLRIYTIDNYNKVTFQSGKFPQRAVLNYFYMLDYFFQDYRDYAPKQLLRLIFHGIYFSRLAGNLRQSVFFLKKAVEANWIIFSVAFVSFVFCWMLPRKLLLFTKERLIKKLSHKIRQILR